MYKLYITDHPYILFSKIDNYVQSLQPKSGERRIWGGEYRD